jgi:hypothetical protein
VTSKFLMASELVQDFGSYQFSKRTTWSVQNVYHLSKCTVPSSLIIWIMVAIFEMQVCFSKWFKCADPFFFVYVVWMINHNNYTLCLHWHIFVNFLFLFFTWSSFWQILWIADEKKGKFQTEHPHYHICMCI